MAKMQLETCDQPKYLLFGKIGKVWEQTLPRNRHQLPGCSSTLLLAFVLETWPCSLLPAFPSSWGITAK